MNQRNPIPRYLWFVIAITASFAACASNSAVATQNEENKAAPVPMAQLGAVAGKQYHGDGLAVVATLDGARLRCAFQRLEGYVTREGLWLSSTAEGSSGERFRVRAMEVGRVTPCAPLEDFGFDFINPLNRTLITLAPSDGVRGLPRSGIVNVADNVARFSRPGLTEEYSVSVDGVRQDFIIEQRPPGDGELRVELEVTGARAEPLVNGARLVLDGSGRKLAYNRLLVVDARGQELTARLEVKDAIHLAVVVEDANAIYPVRIDPTFSDADWMTLGPGMNNAIQALAISGTNVYAGGRFTMAGGSAAYCVAKWNGNVWLALGSGMNDLVLALAVSGTNLYAGGYFTMAGGVSANRIARWNGSNWSALGSGMGPAWNLPNVCALAVSGSNLYAGGSFATAGSVTVNNIARWNGSSWSGLSSGMNHTVEALAVSGTDLYAGGWFTTAGFTGANGIAKWNGSSWSALGSGMSGSTVNIVYALAVSGSNLYAGGLFPRAGSSGVACIAKWNGSSWSPLGSGVAVSTNYIPTVRALAVAGNDLYAGGDFTKAGGNVVNRIAKWDGSGWSALGSGMNTNVLALAVTGSDLYVGGQFTTAGTNAANYIAKSSIVPDFYPGRFSNLGYSPATGFSCTFLDASVGQPYRIQTSPSPVAGGWTDFTNFTYTGPIVITDASALSGTNKFFRAITP